MTKTKKLMTLVPIVGLFLAGCSFEEVKESVNNSWFGEHVLQPINELINGDKDKDQNKEDTENKASSEEGKELDVDKAIDILVSDICAKNITYDANIVATRPDYQDETKTMTVISNQTMEKDGNKFHSYTVTENGGSTYISDLYLEEGADKNYLYQKDNDGKWVKEEDTTGMSFSYDENTVGFTESLKSFKASAVLKEDGSFYAENVSYDVDPKVLINQMGSIMYKDYTCTQEKVTFTNGYIKIGIKDNHLSFYECLAFSITMDVDTENKTITFVKDEKNIATTKIYNVRNIGTTIVTLPTVE